VSGGIWAATADCIFAVMKTKPDKRPEPDSMSGAIAAFLHGVDFVGWNTQGTSDKIWGYMTPPGGRGVITFWGKRNGPWTFKHVETYSGGKSVYVLADEKRRDGYDETSIASLGIARQFYLSFCRTELIGLYHKAP
jgi:hypothetical protein